MIKAVPSGIQRGGAGRCLPVLGVPPRPAWLRGLRLPARAH